MKSAICDRMKQYEAVYNYRIPRKTYTIIRLDGKAFHSYTKGFDRPYDLTLMNVMDETAKRLCGAIQGARFAYTQLDEISVLLSDFDTINTALWFDGKIQKIASVSASIATAFFNNIMPSEKSEALAFFDSRVFQIPHLWDVYNYFVWRQQDATRNSISMAAQSEYSHKKLLNVNTSEMQDMLMGKGINWNDYPSGFKGGRFIEKTWYNIPIDELNKKIVKKNNNLTNNSIFIILIIYFNKLLKISR